VNPLFRNIEEIKGLNRQLILVGAAEFVLHEDIAWADKCQEAGVECTIVREWGQMHIYAMGSRRVAESVRVKTDKLILDWIEESII
jgi:acetyl esterase/lipase